MVDIPGSSPGGPMMLPGFYALVCILLMALLHRLFPLYHIVESYSYFGFVLVAASAILGVWAAALFAVSRTTLDPHGMPSSLVTTGPYRMSRNPMYLSLGLFLLGVGLLLGSVSALVVPFLFILLIDRNFIRAEEEKLKELFPREFARYAAKTRRWL